MKWFTQHITVFVTFCFD